MTDKLTELLTNLKFQAKQEMKEKRESALQARGYEAPHAWSVAVAQEGILCASPSDDDLDGKLEGFEETEGVWA